MDADTILTKKSTVTGLTEITNQLLNGLPSAIQLHTETVDAEELLGCA